MIEKPQVLSETPQGSTDLLSDLLGKLRISGIVLFRAELREPWLVYTPPSRELAQMLPGRAAHLIPFHVISAGGCRLELAERKPELLNKGDVVLLPYGDSHHLGGGDATDSVQLSHLLPSPPWPDIPVVEYGGMGAATHIICGFLQCDELLFHPILRHLPAVMHISPNETGGDNWLASTIRHTATEATKPMPGTREMLPRLTELMFVEILRKHLHGLSADEVGWFAAFNDPVVGGALKCMHAAPLQRWSVESLALRVGASRTILADRFKHFLNQPPMKYLAHWRLVLAAQLIRSGDDPMKTIAEQSGYESEAAFNRAFKRHFGLPPGDWRRQQAQL
jgi:AraC-like DNA-binding protein